MRHGILSLGVTKGMNHMDYEEMIKQLYQVEKLQGYNENEIAYVKDYFGALPEVLENFWRKAGATKELHHGQDFWVKPSDFQKRDWLKDRDHLILMTENQNCCRAGIRKDDLTEKDPPVYVTIDDDDWALCAGSVSEFLQGMSAYQAIFTFDYCAEDFVLWIEEEEQEIIQSNLGKKPFTLHNWQHMDMSFYSNEPDNMVVIMDCGDLEVIYGAASKESYDKLMEVMEGLGEA